MTIELDGRTVIVTGGGRGLGREYCLLLARHGARVVVNDNGVDADGRGHDASIAESVATEIRSSGGEAIANSASVADAGVGEELVALALDEYGSVDGLVHNAGILRDRTLAKMTPDDVDEVLAVHLVGAFNVVLPAFRVMKENQYGRVVVASSSSGLLGNFGQANYGAAKMGLVGLMHVVAIEGQRYGVTANAIAPLARTRMTEALLGDLGEQLDPELVAPMVVYLASPQCSVTHEVYSAGGGRYARFFVGASPGWFAENGSVPSPDEIEAHLDDIRSLDGYHVLNAGPEETALVQSGITR